LNYFDVQSNMSLFLWEAKDGMNISVRDIALRIIESSDGYYQEDLLLLIPEDLLGKKLSDDNLLEVSEEIDKRVGYVKHNEMAKMLGLGEKWFEISAERKAWKKVVNSELNSLPSDQEAKRREVAFCFNLAATIVHQ